MNSELLRLKIENGFVELVECSKEDTVKYKGMEKEGFELPEGIYHSKMDLKYYKCLDKGISDHEVQQILLFQNASSIKRIEKYALRTSSFLVLLVILQTFILFMMM